MTLPDPADQSVSGETLPGYISLVRRLAVYTAELDFYSVTATSNWTMVDVEVGTDRAIERMEMTSRGMLIAKGIDPDEPIWRRVWTATEASYRETMAALLKAAGRQGRGTLQ